MKDQNWDVWELKILGMPFRWARLSISHKPYIPPKNSHLVDTVWEASKREAIKKAVWYRDNTGVCK